MPVQRMGCVYGEQYYNALGFAGFAEAVSGSKGFLYGAARRANVALPALDDISEAEPLPIHLNADQWLVACPDCRNDYQIAWRRTRIYMCPNCWNASAGGQWRRYEWPDEEATVEAEVAKIARPDERNWMPGWKPDHAVKSQGDKQRVSTSQLFEALGRGRAK